MERVTGIEPALSAWEAEVLPLNHTRMRRSEDDRSHMLPESVGGRERDACPGGAAGRGGTR